MPLNLIKPTVLFTDHSINQYISKCFAYGAKTNLVHVNDFSDFNHSIAVYGYLRGTGEAIKKSKDFWYIDHGYFKQSSRSFKNNRVTLNAWDGYFRIVHNNYWHSGSGSYPEDRLNKLNIKFKSQRKTGEYIIVSEPTADAIKYYELYNWTSKTNKIIRKYSDRKIIIHNRHSKIPLIDILKNAWAFVSDHSGAAFLSMIEGVPAFFTNQNLQNIGNIKNIESQIINYNIFNNLAYGQWNTKEMYGGEAWDFFSKDHLNN